MAIESVMQLQGMIVGLGMEHRDHRTEVVAHRCRCIGGACVDDEHSLWIVVLVRLRGGLAQDSARRSVSGKLDASRPLLIGEPCGQGVIAGMLAEIGDEVAGKIAMDDDPSRRHAGLARVEPGAIADRSGGELRISIAQNNGAVSAGEFEGARGQGLGKTRRDRAPDLRRSREDDVVEPVVIEEPLSGVARRLGPRQSVLIQARASGKLEQGELDPGGSLAGLDDHGVAPGYCLDELDAQELHGIVPGCDDRDTPERRADETVSLTELPERPAANGPGRENPSRVAFVPSA